jgi:hypothetical protein
VALHKLLYANGFCKLELLVYFVHAGFFGLAAAVGEEHKRYLLLSKKVERFASARYRLIATQKDAVYAVNPISLSESNWNDGQSLTQTQTQNEGLTRTALAG